MTSEPSGAQWERTRLAWRRTVLTATVVALLGVRQAVLADSGWARVAGTAAVILVWLTGLVAAHRRIAGLARGEQSAGRAPALAGAVVVGLTVVTLLLLG